MAARPSGRQVTNILLVVIVLLLIAFVLTLTVFRNDGSKRTALPTPSPTPSATSTGSAMSSPTPTRSASPSPLPPALTAQGAILRSAGADNDPRPLGASCEGSFHTATYEEVGCNKIAMAAGDIYWVVQRKDNGAGATQILVHIRYFVPAAGGWVIALKALETTGAWFDVDVLARNIGGTGKPNAIVAYSFSGSGTVLEYDVLSWPAGRTAPYIRFHRGGLNKGRFRTSSGKIEDWGANFDDGAPNCCPNFFNYTRIEFLAGEFRIASRQRVRTSSVPAGEL